MPRDQVFISYSHRDAAYLQQLETQLKVLEVHRGLEVWSDHRRLEAGHRWRAEIEAALARTKVAVLLVSPDFLASDFIRNDELRPLLKAAQTDGVRIVWVPLRPSLVLQTPLADFQAAWPPNQPLSSLRKAQREQAWVQICEQIRRGVESPATAPAASEPAHSEDKPATPSSLPQKTSKDRPGDGPAKPPGTLGSWVFGSLTLLFLALAFFWPSPISPQRWQILRVVASAMAGFFGVFMSGQLLVQIGHETSKFGSVAARGTGGFALFLLVFSLWPASTPEVYRLRVTVRDPDGAITTDATLKVRPVGEVQKTNSGWVVEVPAALLPADQRVLVEATLDEALPGEQAIQLGEDFNPEVEIKLVKKPDGEVRGTVVDDQGQPIAGATVSIHGYGEEAVTTGTTGSFKLVAHAPEGASVQLQVVALGYRPANPYVLVGGIGAKVQLLSAEGFL